MRPLGGSTPRPVDFRLISATNRNLDEMLAQGLFREDLFYRVHVASICMPPLRDRREDIPLLVEHFMHECCSEPLELANETMAFLCAYSWPGNIRELRNEVWRLGTSVPGGKVSPHRLSKNILRRLPTKGPSSYASGSLWNLENEIIGGAIRDALHRAGGNRAQAAKSLGISRATLYRRMERYGIRPPGTRSYGTP